MSSVVRFPALLRYADIESQCTMEAWVERSSPGRLFTRCRTTGDSPDLPDGPYDVILGSHSVRTRKLLGSWELVFVPSKLGIELVRLWSREAADESPGAAS